MGDMVKWLSQQFVELRSWVQFPLSPQSETGTKILFRNMVFLVLAYLTDLYKNSIIIV